MSAGVAALELKYVLPRGLTTMVGKMALTVTWELSWSVGKGPQLAMVSPKSKVGLLTAWWSPDT